MKLKKSTYRCKIYHRKKHRIQEGKRIRKIRENWCKSLLDNSPIPYIHLHLIQFQYFIKKDKPKPICHKIGKFCYKFSQWHKLLTFFKIPIKIIVTTCINDWHFYLRILGIPLEHIRDSIRSYILPWCLCICHYHRRYSVGERIRLLNKDLCARLNCHLRRRRHRRRHRHHVILRVLLDTTFCILLPGTDRIYLMFWLEQLSITHTGFTFSNDRAQVTIVSPCSAHV